MHVSQTHLDPRIPEEEKAGIAACHAHLWRCLLFLFNHQGALRAKAELGPTCRDISVCIFLFPPTLPTRHILLQASYGHKPTSQEGQTLPANAWRSRGSISQTGLSVPAWASPGGGWPPVSTGTRLSEDRHLRLLVRE